jgi:hypothetical protein
MTSRFWRSARGRAAVLQPDPRRRRYLSEQVTGAPLPRYPSTARLQRALWHHDRSHPDIIETAVGETNPDADHFEGRQRFPARVRRHTPRDPGGPGECPVFKPNGTQVPLGQVAEIAGAGRR